jgi:hypothetical protein
MSTCNGCGAAIRWAITPNGRRMPVDAKPEKRIVLDDVRLGDDPPTARVVDTYVSHFATCPKAQQFRKGSPREVSR